MPDFTYLEFDCFVHLAALRTSGAVHVWIICINVTTSSTTKDVVLACRGFEAAPPQLRIDRNSGQSCEQNHDVSKNEGLRRHLCSSVHLSINPAIHHPFIPPLAPSFELDDVVRGGFALPCRANPNESCLIS